MVRTACGRTACGRSRDKAPSESSEDSMQLFVSKQICVVEKKKANEQKQN